MNAPVQRWRWASWDSRKWFRCYCSRCRAGHVADNFNRKRVVMWMTVVLAMSSAGVAVISVLQAPVYWIYLCLFVGGTARTFMWAANAAFLPALVDRKVFPRAVNWNVSVFYLSSIIGPATAGGIIAWMAGHHSASPAAPFTPSMR